MARITVDGQTFAFDFSKVSNVEAMAVEDLTGWTFQQWGQKLEQGSIRALTVMVWLMRRRDEPGLAFDAVTFNLAELDVSEDEVPKDVAVTAVLPDVTPTSTSSPDGVVSPLLTSIG